MLECPIDLKLSLMIHDIVSIDIVRTFILNMLIFLHIVFEVIEH